MAPITLDTTVLTKLGRNVTPGMIPKLIEAFLQELDTRIATIQNTPFKGNEQQIRLQVHSIKSTSRTFGAIALADKAAAIEQMIDDQASEADINLEIPQLVALLPLIKEAYLSYQAEGEIH